MIHYTCDRCRREIDPARHTRYVVQIEVQAAIDGSLGEFDDDVDHLSELNQLLEATGDEDLASELADASHRGRYDLCPECHRQFLKNPLGRDSMLALGFSNN